MNETVPTEVIGCILDASEDAKTEILGYMNEDQKRALRLALNHALGDTTEVSREDRELVLRLLGKESGRPQDFERWPMRSCFRPLRTKAHSPTFGSVQSSSAHEVAPLIWTEYPREECRSCTSKCGACYPPLAVRGWPASRLSPSVSLGKARAERSA